MSFVEHTLFGVVDKVATAIERFRMFEPPEGYYLAFSGGKDSVVILHLAKRSGVKFDAHYNLTTVDPPELVHFIKRNHPEVEVHRPERTMWQLIIDERMPPTRIARYCCEELKEHGGENRTVVTGVRWEESNRRSKRRVAEQCFSGKRNFLNPIIDWTEEDVWQYIRENDLPYCSLYDEGQKRIGCIGCPQGGAEQMKRQFERWPQVRVAYVRAFDKCIKKRLDDGLETTWNNGEAMMDWWINGSAEKADPDQTVMFE